MYESWFIPPANPQLNLWITMSMPINFTNPSMIGHESPAISMSFPGRACDFPVRLGTSDRDGMDLEEEDTEVGPTSPRWWISFGVIKHGNLGNPLSEFSRWGSHRSIYLYIYKWFCSC